MKKLMRALCLLAVVIFPVFALAEDGRLSTHILDVSRGEPARNVTITLYQQDGASDAWKVIATRVTDENGRVTDLVSQESGDKGVYKLRFQTAEYFEAMNLPSIYPFIDVVFRMEGEGHYHIPITLSANGYSTYRGN